VDALTSSTTQISKAGRTQVRSVTLTAFDGTDATLKLYDYANSNGEPRLVVHANDGGTVQLSYEGLVFSGGVLAVPDADTENFVIEYE
jgi:hypothetical protein